MSAPKLARIRAERRYNNFDVVELHPDKLPNYDAKIKMFFEEHLHEDEEIRFVLAGQGYFDCRDDEDRWIRIFVKQHDMIVLPAGMYHRFTLDTHNYIHVMRLFQDEPRWVAHNRSAEADAKPSRSTFLGKRKQIQEDLSRPRKNGRAIMIADAAAPSDNFPHMREVNGFIYVSGLSSRRVDGTYIGMETKEDGSVVSDVEAQVEGCLDNLSDMLGAVGVDLSHLVDVTVFLTDMAHFAAYNKIYNAYFDASTGPTRTTVAVKELPNAHQLVEIKAVCVSPSVQAAAGLPYAADM